MSTLNESRCREFSVILARLAIPSDFGFLSSSFMRPL